MSSTQSPPNRFRIERLEERTAPGFLFWMDDLSARMLAQWAVFTGSDARPLTQFTTVRSGTPEQVPVHEIRPSATSGKERVEFPVWADVLLQDIDRQLDGNSKSVPAQKGGTEPLPFFSGIMKRACQVNTSKNRFPAWAQELLADLDGRSETDAVAQSDPEHGARPSENLDEVMSRLNLSAPKPEVHVC